MKKISVLWVAVLITMSIFMQGCYCLPIPLIADPSEMFGCSHEWQDATCTTPRTCVLCGETQGEAIGHKITVTSNYCEFCGEFEYYELRAVKGVVDKVASDYDAFQQQGYIERFEILDVCYVVTDNCQCCCCDKYEYEGFEKGAAGEPYLTVFILFGIEVSPSGESLGWFGESGVKVETFGVHKLHDESADTYYESAVYALEYWFYWSDNELDKVYAQDNSFYYEAENLTDVSMREILSN